MHQNLTDCVNNLHYEKFQDGSVKCIEDEIPFELPEGWEWTRLKNIFNVCSSKRVLQSDWKTDGIPFYRAREIVKLSDNGFVNNELFISEEHFISLSRDYGVPQPGDLMVSGVGTIGKVYIVKSNDRFYYKDASVLCFENRTGAVHSEFARILLESSFIQAQMKDNSKGTTVDTITISAAMNYLCILPPAYEQERIIQAVQNALVHVEKLQMEKENLHTILSVAKSKILDLAIRGKLVPQDPNDEPASVLLERIRTEKEELIKQGKIKRDKKESIIFRGDDNSYFEKIGNDTFDITDSIPFKIPITWMWCRLKCVTANEDNSFVDGPFGSDLKTIHYTEKEEVRIVQLNNIGEEGWKDTGKKYTTFLHAKNIERCISFPNDIVIAKMMPAGRTIILPTVNSMYVISSDCIRLRSDYRINKEYLMYMLNSPTINKYVLDNVQGIGRTRTSLNKMKDILIPVPPESEQQKICKMVNMCFAYLSTIHDEC